jgi:hypothetical protein
MMFKTTKLDYFATIFWVLVQGRTMHPKQQFLGFGTRKKYDVQDHKIGYFATIFWVLVQGRTMHPKQNRIGFLKKEE